MKPIKSLGVVAFSRSAETLHTCARIQQWSRAHGMSVLFHPSLRGRRIFGARTARSENALVAASDALVSVGGDGTFLATAHLSKFSRKPIVGINLGSLGFLTQLTPHQLVPALDAICKGDYQIEPRMVLRAETEGMADAESPYALNDVVVNNGPVSRLININLSVNGEDIVTYNADGLVISTPTGSTAYSLAVGGPIMHPRMEAMIAAPISAFALTTRPMIFAPDDVLEVKIVSPDHKGGLALDGQVMLPIKGSASVIIKRADFNLKFIVFPDNTFYKVLKSKLHWGHTPRAL